MIAKCSVCDGTGEVDSGAPDPQGQYIYVPCGTCTGLVEVDTRLGEYAGQASGIKIYRFVYGEVGREDRVVFIAIDPDWQQIVDSDKDEDTLSDRLLSTYW